VVVDRRSEFLYELIEGEFGLFVENVFNYNSDGFLMVVGNGCSYDLGEIFDCDGLFEGNMLFVVQRSMLIKPIDEFE
jgi:hypothetical protein